MGLQTAGRAEVPGVQMQVSKRDGIVPVEGFSVENKRGVV